jgi:hypothetical protein
MTVEDGPTFAFVKDDLRLVEWNFGKGCIAGYECAHWDKEPMPTIKRSVSNLSNVSYSIEFADGSELPSGLSVTREFPPSKAFFKSGSVFNFYDQATVRVKAVDSDNTIGYSNWFKLGTLGPKAICKPYAGQDSITLPAIVGKAFLGSGYRIPFGINTNSVEYSIIEGALPAGLSFDESSGLISGTPSSEEVQDNVLVQATFTAGMSSSSETCGPYRFEVRADDIAIKNLAAQNSFHAGTPIEVKFTVSGGLVDGYDVRIVSEMSNLPSEVQLIKTGDFEWTLQGVASSIGTYSGTFELLNGNGDANRTRYDFRIMGPLSIENVTNNFVEVPQFKIDNFFEFSHSNVIDSYSITLDETIEYIDVSGDFLAGGTILPLGMYGPFVATITDGVGATASTEPFNVRIVEREGLKGTLDELSPFVVNSERSVKPFKVDQEQLAASMYRLEYAISPETLPEGLTFGVNDGVLKGTATTPGVFPNYMITATEIGVGGTSISSPMFDIHVVEPQPIGTIQMAELEGNKNGVVIKSQKLTSVLERYQSRIVGKLEDVKVISINPTVPGLSFDETSGSIQGIATAEFSGDVTISIEDSSGRPGELVLPVKIYPYPELSANSPFEIPRLSDAKQYNFKIVANEGFYAGQTFSLSPDSQQAFPTGLSIDSSGNISGKTTLAAGSVRNVVVRATSNANGIVVNLPVTFRVVDAVPMTLSIPDDVTVVFKLDDITGNVISTAPVAFVPDQYLKGSAASPIVWSLRDAPSWLSIDASTGRIFANAKPSHFREWAATVVVTDGEGKKAFDTLKVKTTLADYVVSLTGSTTIGLRQNETFELPEQILANVIAPYTFSISSSPVNTTEFNTSTGKLSGYVGTPGNFSWTLNVLDAHDRGFLNPIGISAYVAAPLSFPPVSPGTYNVEQYNADNGIDLALPGVDHAIGSIAYAIDGDIPGTLFYKSKNSDGRNVYLHFPVTGGVQTTVQQPGETVEVVEARLAPDRMIFDTQNLTMKGVPSQTGTFQFYIGAHDDHEETGYQVNPADPTRRAYNNAYFGPVTINVSAKSSMGLVASTSNPRYLIVNNQDANMLISAKNAAYGDVSWTVNGTDKLPPGVSYAVTDQGVKFSGTPTLIGTFSGVTVTATDIVGGTASMNISFNVIASPDAIELDVADITTKVGYPIAMNQPYATSEMAWRNTYGSLLFQSPDVTTIGATINPETGEIGGQATAVGNYTFNVSVTDDTDRITSRSVNVTVLPALRLIVPSIVEIEKNVNTIKNIATDYAIGDVTYRKGEGIWPAGLTVNPANGSIMGATNSPVGTYEGLTVIGIDEVGDEQSSNEFSISITPVNADPDIADIAGGRLNLGLINVAASWQPTVIDDVYGMTWDYEGTVYSINKPLPAGLEFDTSTGVISGTPTETANVTGFVVTVTATNGRTDSTAPFTLAVNNAELTKANDTVVTGFAIGSSLPTFSGPPGSYARYEYIGLPEGLFYETTTGKIWGETSEEGVHNVTIRANVLNSTGGFVEKDFTITVSDNTFYRVQITATRDPFAIACFGSVKVYDTSGADITALTSFKQPPGTYPGFGNVQNLGDDDVSQGSVWCGHSFNVNENDSFYMATGGRPIGSVKFIMRNTYNDSFPVEWNIQRKDPGGSFIQIMSKAIAYDPDMRGKEYWLP